MTRRAGTLTARAARKALAAVAACAALGAALWLAAPAWHAHGAAAALAQRVASVRQPAAQDAFDCAALAGPAAFGVLVLGQSNAANHGEPGAAAAPIDLLVGGRCYRASGPLAGATGDGASLWPQLAARARPGRHLLFGVVAVDNTSIGDWRAPGPLDARLRAEIDGWRRAGVTIDLVLWQQGEADARDRTTEDAYFQGLVGLRARLRGAGLAAPLVVARASYCPGSDGAAVRAAQARFVRSGAALAGPDLDTLRGTQRIGCHFSASGVTAAASLWAEALGAAGVAAAPWTAPQ